MGTYTELMHISVSDKPRQTQLLEGTAAKSLKITLVMDEFGQLLKPSDSGTFERIQWTLCPSAPLHPY